MVQRDEEALKAQFRESVAELKANVARFTLIVSTFRGSLTLRFTKRGALNETLELAKSIDQSLAKAKDLAAELGVDFDMAGVELESDVVSVLKRDKFLLVSFCVALVGSALVIHQAVINWSDVVAFLQYVFGYITNFSAQAAEVPPNGIDIKTGARITALLGLLLLLFAAFAAATLHKSPDVRKFGADTVKTIVGLFVGLLIRLGD
jgi:hypothetical protein